MVSTDFHDLWEAIRERIQGFAHELEIDPNQIVQGSYSQMTVTAPAIVVYLEPYDALMTESGSANNDRATCICFFLVESTGEEWETVSRGVDLARATLAQLQDYQDNDHSRWGLIDEGVRPVTIDDVYSTHAVITLKFTIPL